MTSVRAAGGDSPTLDSRGRCDRRAPMPTSGTVEFWSGLAHHGRQVEAVRSASTEDLAEGAGKAVGQVVAVAPELHEVENGRWPIGLATNASAGDADPQTHREIAGGVAVVVVVYLRRPAAKEKRNALPRTTW